MFSILKNPTTHLSVRGWEGIRLPNDGRSKESGFLSILRHAWILRNLNICTLPFKHICWETNEQKVLITQHIPWEYTPRNTFCTAFAATTPQKEKYKKYMLKKWKLDWYKLEQRPLRSKYKFLYLCALTLTCAGGICIGLLSKTITCKWRNFL